MKGEKVDTFWRFFVFWVGEKEMKVKWRRRRKEEEEVWKGKKRVNGNPRAKQRQTHSIQRASKLSGH